MTSLLLPRLRRHFPVAAALAYAVLALPAIQAAEKPDLGEPKAKPVSWNNPDHAPTHPQGIRHGSLRSSAMGLEIGHNVYLPPGYEHGDRRYPVIYFLHGWGGDENSDAAAFADAAVQITEKLQLPPAILVFPNGGRSWYRDYNPERGLIETHLIQELVPYIDRTYRTLADREHRSIVGFSMGGGGAVRLATKYPGLFSAAGAWGGAFAFRDPNPIPNDLTSEHFARVAGRVRVLLSVGTADSQLLTHPAFFKILADAKFPCEIEVLEGVPHDPGAYYRVSGERMLRFLTTGW
jgi:endo-1,4-beta-xylanase